MKKTLILKHRSEGYCLVDSEKTDDTLFIINTEELKITSKDIYEKLYKNLKICPKYEIINECLELNSDIKKMSKIITSVLQEILTNISDKIAENLVVENNK